MGKLTKLVFFSLVILTLGNFADGDVFWSDGFNYADGDLTTVSSGAWVQHSGSGDIQVVNGRALLANPGSQDDNRQTGAVMGNNDIWYYGVRFSIAGGGSGSINEDYFIHFKDDTLFGFNARLFPTAPSAGGDFGLAIAASSIGEGQADWSGDFMFGEEILAIVEWNNAIAEATLWVNPLNMSGVSVSDDELPDGMRAIESVALRQDSGSGLDTARIVDRVAVGTDFNAVLTAMTIPEPGSLTLFGFIGFAAMVKRRRTS